MEGKQFPSSWKALKEMKSIIASDNSSANIHSVFMGKCKVGGSAFNPGLCKSNHNVNVNCHNYYKKPTSMAFTVTHEMGHNLGRGHLCLKSSF